MCLIKEIILFIVIISLIKWHKLYKILHIFFFHNFFFNLKPNNVLQLLFNKTFFTLINQMNFQKKKHRK